VPFQDCGQLADARAFGRGEERTEIESRCCKHLQRSLSRFKATPEWRLVARSCKLDKHAEPELFQRVKFPGVIDWVRKYVEKRTDDLALTVTIRNHGNCTSKRAMLAPSAEETSCGLPGKL
jgi:hypothetical protein